MTHEGKPEIRNVQAEAAVLGSILINPTVLPRVEQALAVNDFTRDNREIFAAMQAVAETGGDIDLITLRHTLKKVGSKVSPVYLASLVDDIPDVANVDRYAVIVREAALNRRIMKLLGKAANQIGEIPPKELVPALAEAMYELVGDFTEAGTTTVDKVVNGLIPEIERRRAEGDYLTGITTGLADLDAYLLGWQPGVLTLIGAYTSMGKTASGLDFAIKALEAPGNEAVHVLYVALEMTKEMLGYRLLANAAGEKLHWVRTGNLSDRGAERVKQGHARVSTFGKRFHITDDAFDIQQIVAIARGLKQQNKLSMVFVDYLQLVQGSDGDNREQEVNLVGKSLLRLAKQLNVPVIAFAQLNDGVVNRESHEPKLSDMRESRALNQHARTVILLNRPWMFDKPADDPIIKPCLTNVHIEKNSESKAGRFVLHFNASFQRFEAGGCHDGCEYYKEEHQEASAWQ